MLDKQSVWSCESREYRHYDCLIFCLSMFSCHIQEELKQTWVVFVELRRLDFFFFFLRQRWQFLEGRALKGELSRERPLKSKNCLSMLLIPKRHKCRVKLLKAEYYQGSFYRIISRTHMIWKIFKFSLAILEDRAGLPCYTGPLVYLKGLHQLQDNSPRLKAIKIVLDLPKQYPFDLLVIKMPTKIFLLYLKGDNVRL